MHHTTTVLFSARPVPSLQSTPHGRCRTRRTNGSGLAGRPILQWYCKSVSA